MQPLSEFANANLGSLQRYLAKPFDLKSSWSHSSQPPRTHWRVVCKCVYSTPMDSDAIIRRLKKEGWQEVHVAGSHHKFKHPDKLGHVVVPHPKRDLPQGTARNIFRQAGWPWRNR